MMQIERSWLWVLWIMNLYDNSMVLQKLVLWTPYHCNLYYNVWWEYFLRQKKKEKSMEVDDINHDMYLVVSIILLLGSD